MKRPKDKDPPIDWFRNDYDDKKWELPTDPTTPWGHLNRPTMWFKEFKYTFYRIGVDTEALDMLH